MRIYNDQVAEVTQSFTKSDLSETKKFEMFKLIPPLFPTKYLETHLDENFAKPCESPIVISSDSDCADY